MDNLKSLELNINSYDVVHDNPVHSVMLEATFSDLVTAREFANKLSWECQILTKEKETIKDDSTT